MNRETRRAATDSLRRELNLAGDNLARAKMQLRADPTWTSGNDEPIGDVVAAYQATYDRFKAALDDMESEEA